MEQQAYSCGEWLFDTGVFYSLSWKDVESIIKCDVLISAGLITPFELLSGLNPEDSDDGLRRRRNAVLKYQQLQVRLYKQTPQEMKEIAFGIQKAYPDRQFVDEALSLVAACENRRQLRALAARDPTLLRLRQEADRVSVDFKNAVSVGTAAHRSLTKGQLQANQLSGSGANYADYICYQREKGDWHRYTLITLSQETGFLDEAATEGEGLFERCLELERIVRTRYDRSLDMYIDGYVEYILRKQLSGGSAHRNDSFDLDHLFYLRPDEEMQKLVTGDDALHSYVAASHPSRVLHLTDVRKHLY
ncbi:MAG: hypothetical protein ACRERE_06655 [Candidatus Entotheonellia bacterium]